MGEERGAAPSGAARRRQAANAAEPAGQDVARVLSVDGGGIRGMLPAMLLAEIEKRCAAPASTLFDLIAGTSTGGIIALGLVVPTDDGKPAFAAADGVAIYMEHGPKIFARGGRDILASMGGLIGERYQADGLEQILDDVFGQRRLSDALTDVLACSYEITRREPYAFSSVRARRDPTHDVLMREAVRSTTAAPTFFEPSRIVDPGGRTHVLIDGAVYANSPAMLAFAEIEKERPDADLVVASVGAGSLTTRFEYEEACDWGVANWARPLLEIVLDGAAATGDHVLGHLLGPDRYFRFQQSLTEASDALDNVKPANLQALRREGQRMIDASSERIDQLCELLVR